MVTTVAIQGYIEDQIKVVNLKRLDAKMSHTIIFLLKLGLKSYEEENNAE